MSPRVAILGTGKMGSAIARRLAELEPVLWNRTPGKAELLALGSVAVTPAEAVRGAEIVISSLTGPGALRATYLGPEGALAGARGQLFVEMSTAGPEALAEIERGVRASQATVIDAPIMGAPTAVLSGQAAILAGGELAAIERARPILERLGEVRRVGPLGSGARLKLIANSMLAIITVASGELQEAGVAAGLEPAEVFWALSRLAPGLGLRRAGYLDHRHQPALFSLRDLRKDLDLAHLLFEQSGAITPITDRARSLMGELGSEADDLDISAVITRFQGADSQSLSGGALPAAVS